MPLWLSIGLSVGVLVALVAIAAVSAFRAGIFIGGRLMALQDQIDKLNTDLDSLAATVTEAVADIASLKAQIGASITPAQSQALDDIATKLEKATSDLKAGE